MALLGEGFTPLEAGQVTSFCDVQVKRSGTPLEFKTVFLGLEPRAGQDC